MDMISSAAQFAGPILGFLAANYGGVALALGYVVLFGIPLVSILIELMDFIVALSVSKADDAVAAKIDAAWAKILPILEVLPHANIPISATLQMILSYSAKGLAALKGAVQGWNQNNKS